MKNKIILASNSPRRRELLSQVGIEFDVVPSGAEEKITSSVPSDVVMELSFQKALDVLKKVSTVSDIRIENNSEKRKSQTNELVNSNLSQNNCDNFGENFGANDERIVVIGADTVVSYKQKILGKPKNIADARRMITALSGGEHEVYTGVTIMWLEDGALKYETFFDETIVLVYNMSEDEIEDYISTDEPYDKAGSYGIQGLFAAYVQGIKGDYNNVVGLPVAKVYHILKKYGFV